MRRVELNADGCLIFHYTDGTQSEALSVRGEKGETGVGIRSVSVTDGDLYITYSDNPSPVFIGNIKGEKGDAGAPGATGARGEKGDRGDDGKSAYALYKAVHPDYTGSPEQWLSDLANGRLSDVDTCTVTFDANGGSNVPAQTVIKGTKATVPTTPTKDGYSFVGWFIQNEQWSFSGNAVTENITLLAHWTEFYTVGLQFSAVNSSVFHPNGNYYRGYEITGYAGTEKNIVIPDTYNGFPVIRIADKAFKEASLKAVKLPNELLEIGESAFYNNPDLKTIDFPDSLIRIYDSAFTACPLNLTHFPRNLWRVGNGAFSGASGTVVVTPGKYGIAFDRGIDKDVTLILGVNCKVRAYYDANCTQIENKVSSYRAGTVLNSVIDTGNYGRLRIYSINIDD